MTNLSRSHLTGVSPVCTWHWSDIVWMLSRCLDVMTMSKWRLFNVLWQLGYCFLFTEEVIRSQLLSKVPLIQGPTHREYSVFHFFLFSGILTLSKLLKSNGISTRFQSLSTHILTRAKSGGGSSKAYAKNVNLWFLEIVFYFFDVWCNFVCGIL